MIRLKDYSLSSLHQTPDSPKIPKRASDIDSTEFSKLYFSLTTGLISSIKASIEKLKLGEDNSIEKPIIFILGSEF